MHGGSVDMADTGLDPLRKRQGPAGVTTENRRREAEIRIVGQPQQRLVTVAAQHHGHRAEGLFAVQTHGICHTVEQRRLQNAALQLPASHQRCAKRHGVVDQALDARSRTHIDQRPEHRFTVIRIASAQGFDLGRQLGNEGIGDLVIHDQPFGRHADLALIEIRAKSCSLYCRVEIRVVEHQKRCLATQFQQCRFQIPRRQLTDDAPDMSGASEIDPSHCRIGNQALDNRRRIGRRVADHVHHTVTQPCILQHLADQSMHGGAELRGLEHHGVAAGEWHGDGTRGKNHRRIPRRDTQDHTTGLA